MVWRDGHGALNEKASAGLLAKNHILCEPNSAPITPGFSKTKVQLTERFTLTPSTYLHIYSCTANAECSPFL
jgi:hypothetical protein